ncbi:Ighm [Phodopus roborovskii]|uniref:Immunoglobulin heavy constant epsilon n=1 Tax=Phodopus roborovskii TaxID=109678 RepID=A0AAU9ZR67_PHORO|nr:Ighm [Phodopus roborovskii]
MTLGCLVKDYFPDPVTVTWYSNTQNMSTVNFPSLSSELMVTTSQVTTWGKSAKNFTCQVAHAPSNFSKSKVIKASLVNITQPTLKLLHSSCDRNAFHSTIHLYCFIQGHILDDITVTWLKDGQEMPSASPRVSLIKKEGKLASTYSELNITTEQWMSESIFTCRVNSQGEEYQASAQKCSEYEPRGVSAYLIPPSPLDLYVHKSPKLTCLVVDLESKENVTVEWTQEHRKPAGSASQSSTRHHNATTSITSTLPVDANDWIEGESYRCSVTLPHLPKSIVRIISKAPGKRSAPEVYVFPPPEKENDGKRTLTCLVQNFFPEDISVQWLQDKTLIPNTQYRTTAPLKPSGSRHGFFVFSRLEVTKAQWAQNKHFTCRVIHEALQEHRKLEKTVSKIPGK